MRPATLITFLVVTLIALLHLLRLMVGVEVTVSGAVVPSWASLPAALFFAGLAAGLWREHKPPTPPAA